MTELNTQQNKALDALFQQAITLHQVGQIHEAEQLYRRILQTWPKHVDANYNLGLIANAAGHLDAGLKHLQLAYDAFPGNTQFVLTYANALANMGYLLDALKVVKTARQQGQDGDELKKMQRQIDEAIQLSLENPSPTQKEWDPLTELFKSQKWQELESRAQKLTGQYKRSGKVWAMLFIALQAQGKDFLEALRKAAQYSPGDLNLQISLSTELLRLGRHEEVEELLRSQIRNHPDSEVPHYNLGVFLTSMNRDLEALSSLNSALAINPEYISALCAVAQLQLKSGSAEQATATLQRALEVKTTNVEEIYILAQNLMSLGQVELAAGHFKKALDLNPKHLLSLNDLGIALKTLGHREDAEKCFFHAIELQPGFVLPYINLGQMRYDAGDLDNAQICFEKVLTLAPNDTGALLYMGSIHINRDKFAEAFEFLNKAVVGAPNHPLIHFNIGLALRGLGQIEASLQGFQNALACKPDFAYAYANAGDIHGLLGQKEQAEQAFATALNMDPQDPRILSLALMHLPYRADDARFAQLEALYAKRSGYGNNERRLLCRAYSKAMEQCGETQKASAALAEATGADIPAQ